MFAIRKLLAVVVIIAGVYIPYQSQAIAAIAPRAVVPSVAVAAYKQAAPEASGFTVAAVVQRAAPKRHTAMRFALAQKGDPYRYGGTGPNSWDCSGLVYKAYQKVGISLPRTTGGMLGSSKLQRISKRSAHWGDLWFASSGHVELVSSQKWRFGAHHSGTNVGYGTYYTGGSFYHVRGSG